MTGRGCGLGGEGGAGGAGGWGSRGTDECEVGVDGCPGPGGDIRMDQPEREVQSISPVIPCVKMYKRARWTVARVPLLLIFLVLLRTLPRPNALQMMRMLPALLYSGV
jgi:hypothetical protein